MQKMCARDSTLKTSNVEILEITNLMLSRFAKVNIFFFPTTETVLKRSYKPYGDVSIIS